MSDHKHNIRKIVLTGPESSGKTQMAIALSEALGCPWTPEFARFYLAHLGRPYERRDLRFIGRGQQLWEAWWAQQATSFLVCDTDWTVLQVWESFRFGDPDEGVWQWKTGYGLPAPADLYLLCAPDFPWAPDPLREHPEAREILFEQYVQNLQVAALSFEVLRGTREERLALAVSTIQKVFGPL